MGKPVNQRFGQMVRQSRTDKFRPGIAFSTGTNGVPFNEKRLRKSETGIKDGFEEIEHDSV